MTSYILVTDSHPPLCHKAPRGFLRKRFLIRSQ